MLIVMLSSLYDVAQNVICGVAGLRLLFCHIAVCDVGTEILQYMKLRFMTLLFMIPTT